MNPRQEEAVGYDNRMVLHVHQKNHSEMGRITEDLYFLPLCCWLSGLSMYWSRGPTLLNLGLFISKVIRFIETRLAFEKA